MAISFTQISCFGSSLKIFQLLSVRLPLVPKSKQTAFASVTWRYPHHSLATMDLPPATDDVMPVFYVGQHEARRSLPVTDQVLRQAQDCNVSSQIYTEMPKADVEIV